MRRQKTVESLPFHCGSSSRSAGRCHPAPPPEQRVHDGVQRRVPVGVPAQAVGVRYHHAAEAQELARGEPMRSYPIPALTLTPPPGRASSPAAAHGVKPAPADQFLHLFLRGAERRPGRETTFSPSSRAEVVGAPKRSATWPIFIPIVTQLAWMLSTLSRARRAMASVRRYWHGVGLGAVRHRGVLRLERPRDERREAAGPRLLIADSGGWTRGAPPSSRRARTSIVAEVRIPCRCARAHHAQPVVRHGLLGRHELAHPVHEDLAAAARDGVRAPPWRAHR